MPSLNHIHAPTASPGLNFVTVGTPAILVPDELKRSRKPLDLPPGSHKTLQIGPPVSSDFFLDYICLTLWQAGENLTYVDPLASDYNVQVNIFDNGAGRYLFDTPIPWQLLSGYASYPFKTDIPFKMNAGCIYNIEVSYSGGDTDLAMSIDFHGRRKRVFNNRLGDPANPIPTDIQTLLNEVCAAKAYRHGALVSDQSVNIRTTGVPHTYSLKNESVTVPSGTYAGDPSASMVTSTLYSDGRYYFFANKMTGTQMYVVSGQADYATMPIDMTQPIFLRLYNEDADEYLTPGFVPMRHVLGWGGRPYILPQDWVWLWGAKITVEFYSMSSLDARVFLNVHGTRILAKNRPNGNTWI